MCVCVCVYLRVCVRVREREIERERERERERENVCEDVWVLLVSLTIYIMLCLRTTFGALYLFTTRSFVLLVHIKMQRSWHRILSKFWIEDQKNCDKDEHR